MPGFFLAHPTTMASRDPVTVRKEVLCMQTSKVVNGKEFKLVFARYIRKNGRTIYPKHGKVFCFWVAA
jgi:hypothetical protein